MANGELRTSKPELQTPNSELPNCKGFGDSRNGAVSFLDFLDKRLPRNREGIDNGQVIQLHPVLEIFGQKKAALTEMGRCHDHAVPPRKWESGFDIPSDFEEFSIFRPRIPW